MIESKIQRVTAAAFEQFLERPENADRLFERIDGEIIEKVPKQLHALIAALLASSFVNYFRQHPIGWVFVEIRVKLSEATGHDFIPDLAVALSEGRALQADESLNYMPEMVVEIQSPDQSDKFMVDKAQIYLNHGTRVVLIVYPSKRIVEVLKTDDRQLLTTADVLDLDELFPELTLPINDIFPPM